MRYLQHLTRVAQLLVDPRSALESTRQLQRREPCRASQRVGATRRAQPRQHYGCGATAALLWGEPRRRRCWVARCAREVFTSASIEALVRVYSPSTTTWLMRRLLVSFCRHRALLRLTCGGLPATVTGQERRPAALLSCRMVRAAAASAADDGARHASHTPAARACDGPRSSLPGRAVPDA